MAHVGKMTGPGELMTVEWSFSLSGAKWHMWKETALAHADRVNYTH